MLKMKSIKIGIMLLVVSVSLSGCPLGCGDLEQNTLTLLNNIEQGMKGEVNLLDISLHDDTGLFHMFSIRESSETLKNELNWDTGDTFHSTGGLNKEQTIELFKNYPFPEDIIFEFPEHILVEITNAGVPGGNYITIRNEQYEYSLYVYIKDNVYFNPFTMELKGSELSLERVQID